MTTKLFMIPWLLLSQFPSIHCQSIAQQPMSPHNIIADPLVDAHHRQFVELLRRQQQINDAFLMNNALLHHNIQPLSLARGNGLIAPQQTQLNPFNPFQMTQATEVPQKNVKEGIANPPKKGDEVSRALADVKTVMIKRENENSTEPQAEATTTTTNLPSTTLSAIEETSTNEKLIDEKDEEVASLFRKLNLSKSETKSIVEHVEQVVREELAKRLHEAEREKGLDAITAIETVEAELSVTSSTAKPTSTSSAIPTTTSTASPTVTTIKSDEITKKEEVVKTKLKHKKKQVHKEDTMLLERGAVKTSLRHLPVYVINEEDGKTPETPSIHRRVVIGANRGETNRINPKSDKIVSIDEEDEEFDEDGDLINEFSPTGPPLDLDNAEKLLTSSLSTPTQSTTTATTSTESIKVTAPPRHPHHVMTNFEKLASDYRQRLQNTGDLSKILQKISENAYITLAAQQKASIKRRRTARL